MQTYKGYFIAGSALLVHPFSPDWYVGGKVLMPGRSGSILEIGRFQLQRFTVSIEELTGMVRAGACPPRGRRMPGGATELNRKYLQRSCPKCGGYLGIVIPNGRRQMAAQAINGRCLKSSYRLPWVVVRAKTART